MRKKNRLRRGKKWEQREKNQKFSTPSSPLADVEAKEEERERRANRTQPRSFQRSLFRPRARFSSSASSVQSLSWQLVALTPAKRKKERKRKRIVDCFLPMDAEAQPRPRSGSAAAAAPLLLRSGSGAPSSGGLLGRVLGTPLKMMAQVREKKREKKQRRHLPIRLLLWTKKGSKSRFPLVFYTHLDSSWEALPPLRRGQTARVLEPQVTRDSSIPPGRRRAGRSTTTRRRREEPTSSTPATLLPAAVPSPPLLLSLSPPRSPGPSLQQPRRSTCSPQMAMGTESAGETRGSPLRPPCLWRHPGAEEARPRPPRQPLPPPLPPALSPPLRTPCWRPPPFWGCG